MSDSFSSDTNLADSQRVDLLAAGAFPPLVESFLRGRDLDLLQPVRFLGPGQAPTGKCAVAAPERSTLAAALAAANTAAGHRSADRLAERLADPATRVVITGQQPGLFGGPLYTLAKAIAVQSWAERLEASGERAVALFWVATEDHDFLESSRAAFFSTEGITTVDLGPDEEALKPVGSRVLGPGVESALATIGRVVPGERYGEWLRRLAEWYRPEARFGDAFTRLMIALLGERCPLMVDSMLPELKAAQRPWLRSLVEKRRELGAAFTTRDQEIVDRGFDLQVKPQPGTSPLFLESGGERRRIEWRDSDHFGLRGDGEFVASIDRLLEIIDQEPDRVSPGVRARSAVQDAVFGTCLQVLGPGELSYLPQAAPLFDLLAIPAPLVALRPQVLVLDERQRSRLTEIGMPLETLLKPDLDLDEWLARPEDVAFVESAAREMEATLQGLETGALEIDPNLEGPLKKTRGQVQKAFEIFASKVTAAAARREEIARNRLTTLREQCLPGGKLQERVIASSHYPGKYGAAFVEAMFEQMDLEPTNLWVVAP